MRDQIFEPTILWKNSHLQTVSRGLLRWPPKISWKRVAFVTSYGDELKADVLSPPEPPQKRLLLIHGITGCSGASPIPELALALLPHRVETWALNLRGADRLIPTIPRLYHAGCSEDLESVFLQLPKSLPWRFAGFSLGANLLLKWLGERSGRNLNAKALAVSCPFDLGECSSNLEKSYLTRCYRYVLIQRLKSLLRPFSRAYPDVVDRQKLESCRTFFDFDEHITAPIHGFEGAEDYWRKCSAVSYLAAITMDTTLLHALDDPFQPNPPSYIGNSKLDWEVYHRGGHVGFQSSWSNDWLVKRIVGFVLSD